MGATPFDVPSTSYLSEGWNILDCLIVLISWASQLGASGSLSSLRMFRALRPLRSISRIPGMRLLVRSMLASLPALRDVLLLFSFFLLAFAIVGVELFRGRLHYRCFDAALGLDAEPGAVCTCRNATRDLELALGNAGCSDLCGAGESCLFTPLNPNNGASSFDHIFDALFAIIQSVSLEGWSDLLHQLSVSQPQLSPIYFIILVVFGAFFVMNLCACIDRVVSKLDLALSPLALSPLALSPLLLSPLALSPLASRLLPSRPLASCPLASRLSPRP